MNSKSGTCGVLYIAFGEKYIFQAEQSARSLKEYSTVPVSIYCDKKPNAAVFDDIRIIEPKHKRSKVDFIGESRYNFTLYIDSDTRICKDIVDLFELFPRFDICGTHDYARKSSRWFGIKEYKEIPYAFPEYNGGLMGFRKCAKTDRFFEDWRRLFYRYREQTNGQDQASLRIALWQSDLAIATLPPEYNVRSEAQRRKIVKRSKRSPEDALLLQPRIYHWHGAETGRLSLFDKKRKPARF